MNKCKSFFLSIWPLKTIEDCKAKSYFCFDRFLRRQSFSCIDNWVTELLHILFSSNTNKDIGLTFAVKSHAVWLHGIFEIFVPFLSNTNIICIVIFCNIFGKRFAFYQDVFASGNRRGRIDVSDSKFSGKMRFGKLQKSYPRGWTEGRLNLNRPVPFLNFVFLKPRVLQQIIQVLCS